MTTEMKFVTQIKNSLRRKTIVRASMLAVLTAAGAMASNPTDAPGIGIDRVDPIPERYAYAVSYRLFYQVPKAGWSTTDAHHFGYGYYNKGLKQIDPGGSQTFVSFGGPGKNSFTPSSELMPRTLTNDIRSSQLDKDLVDTILAEGKYSEVWLMSPDNKQGELWKRQAIAQANDKIIYYTEQGVFQDRQSLIQKATAILAGFYTTDMALPLYQVYQNLSTVYQTTRTEAEAAKQKKMASVPNADVLIDVMVSRFMSDFLD